MEAGTYTIEGGDYDRGGSASEQLKEMLKRIGVEPKAVRRTMVAAYEAEMNVVVHARRGVMKVAVTPTRVEVALTDEGPGIPDIPLAMKEGYSTAPAEARSRGFGAGMGLPNIRRSTDRFSIQSALGRGTHLRFSINLQPPSSEAVPLNSISVLPGRCRQCLRCLHTCPMQAVRVRAGTPRVLESLCIDCTECIAVCEPRAFTMDCATEAPEPTEDMVLVLPVSFLEQFGAGVAPLDVLEALHEMGFRKIRLGEEWDGALRLAVLQYAQEEACVRPVLSPVCPAAVNLIQVRFPSLLSHLAPFATPMETARDELDVPRAVFVPACPSQLTIMRAPNLLTRIDVVAPAAMRRAVLKRVANRQREQRGAASAPGEPLQALQVSGIGHVMRVLNAIENGSMAGYGVIELYACDQGCFGSPVWTEDPFVARPRFEPGTVEAYRELQEHCGERPGEGVTRRTTPLAPRAGVRLDADMGRAIEQLAQIEALARTLPGRNCGVCGSPDCVTLAEDIVLGRADAKECAYLGERKDDARTDE
ncbi:MAG: (Fe-S)-binding protein [FCB group bacterium]|jgi:anti-sigma regulatory factor (Ser/Thr protein kinase)/Na+-translocating ferredoxin:NAD+ oxidoreductase RNF subunit RnfB|nr:(Fe-S)-binding protein [FCB group bacterium]